MLLLSCQWIVRVGFSWLYNLLYEFYPISAWLYFCTLIQPISLLLQFCTLFNQSACYYSFAHFSTNQLAITVLHTYSTNQLAITVLHTYSTNQHAITVNSKAHAQIGTRQQINSQRSKSNSKPASGQRHSDRRWQHWGWRAGRDGRQWEGCLSLFKFEVLSQLWNEHNLSIIASLAYE